MLWSLRSATPVLPCSRILQTQISHHGRRTISTMSAIKKGLRKSDSTSRTRMKETRFAPAERPRAPKSDTLSRRTGQPSSYSNTQNARNAQLDVKRATLGQMSAVRNSTTTRREKEKDSSAGALRSYGHSRGRYAGKVSTDSARSVSHIGRNGSEAGDRSTGISKWRRESDSTSFRNTPQRLNTLRLQSIGGQEQEEFDNAHRITKVVPYDAAEEKKERRQERVTQREARDPTLSKDYVKIQRSTAASEFIYGRSSVLAALKLGSRRLYKLYIARTTEESAKDFEDVIKYALNRGTPVVWVTNSQSQAEMDRIAKSRPHNGVVLEASPLPKLPVRGLRQAYKGQPFEIELQRQSIEEEQINGSDAMIPCEASFPRYPFLIMLDEIVDQGNLGGILRSAYFLGADAVVLSSHMAALNTVALKAASGAAEGIKLLSVHNTTGFLQTSQENGWKVYAAVAPPTGQSPRKSKHVDLGQLGHPLQDSPCILMLGNEGEGLRRDLIALADQTLSIPGQRHSQSGVDSLNVSVAAGILMDAFLKKPEEQQPGSSASDTSPSTNLLF